MISAIDAFTDASLMITRHHSYAIPVGARRLLTCLLTVETLKNACPGDKAPIRQGRCHGHSMSLFTLYPHLVNYPPIGTDLFVVFSVVQYALLWHALDCVRSSPLSRSIYVCFASVHTLSSSSLGYARTMVRQ